jgi:RNA polymerase sigma-70 factor (ECF subfamily)
MVETRVSLLQRVRDHSDNTAWTQFFAIYNPLLTAYVRKQGLPAQEAADVVQDVFAKLVPAMAKFQLDSQRGRFRSWLWRVTHNALADWARRQSIRNRAEKGWIDQQPRENDTGSTEEWNDFYHRRMMEVAIERVRAVTQPATWACFDRKILAGRPAAQVAAELDVSTNVVYVNASRVLAKVREEMAILEESLTEP